MKRYAVITEVKLYAGEDEIATIYESDTLGFKAKLKDTFMSGADIAFVGKVLEYLDEDGDLEIEEEI